MHCVTTAHLPLAQHGQQEPSRSHRTNLSGLSAGYTRLQIIDFLNHTQYESNDNRPGRGFSLSPAEQSCDPAAV